MIRALGWAAFLTTAVVVLCWPLACGTFPPPVPSPAPVADAGPADVFAGQIFDCHAVPIAERTAALAPVGVCLDGPPAPYVELVVDAASPCLAGLVGSFSATTIACIARDLGAATNLAGDATQRPKADNARAWITSHALGCK